MTGCNLGDTMQFQQGHWDHRKESQPLFIRQKRGTFTVQLLFFSSPDLLREAWDPTEIFPDISSGISKGFLRFWFGLFIKFLRGKPEETHSSCGDYTPVLFFYLYVLLWQVNGASGICALFNICIILSHKSYATSSPHPPSLTPPLPFPAH